MAGESNTNQFMLSTATVMLGQQTDLYNLNPAAHSIGLVKNFVMSASPEYVELSQGIKNTLVDSQLTSNKVVANMEVYEYTSTNLTYALGLDGSVVAKTTANALMAAVVPAATNCVIAGDQSSIYQIGDFIYLQPAAAGTADIVHIAKLTGVTVVTDTTLDFTGQPVPAGVSYAAGDIVSKVNQVKVGSKDPQGLFGAKIVGIMPNGNRPVTILMPKVRITQGFNIGFVSDQYGNLPFEFTPLDVTGVDDLSGSGGPNLYADFKGVGSAGLFVGA